MKRASTREMVKEPKKRTLTQKSKIASPSIEDGEVHVKELSESSVSAKR
jgi:hypothetical protein